MKGKRFLRAVCVTLCIMLATGCGRLYEDNDPEGLPDVARYGEESLSVPRDIAATLYFFDEEDMSGEGERRDIVIDSEQREEEKIVKELLAGPKTEGLVSAAQARLSHIEVMDDVINVYLVDSEGLLDGEKYLLATQIADTLIEAEDIEFVCVFFDGEALSCNGYPIGALARSGGDAAEDYDELCEKIESSKEEDTYFSLYVPLYFVSMNLKYFVPETRRIVVNGRFSNPDEFNAALIKKIMGGLADGPETKYFLTTYVNGDYLSESNYQIYNDGGRVTVNKRSGIFFLGVAAERAALCYTLLGVMGRGEPLTVVGAYNTSYDEISREDARANAGSVIIVSLPDMQSGRLEEVTRTVAEADAAFPRIYLAELFDRLADDGYLGKRAHFSMDNVRSIHYSDTVLRLDLTHELMDELRALKPEYAKSVIYSMINTLCATWVTEVLIREEGEVPEPIGGIDLEYPLMPDHGLIK